MLDRTASAIKKMKSNGDPRGAAALSGLVHQIYEASVHPERWNDAVAAIAASFGSTKGLLFTPYMAPQHGGLIFPYGISEATLQLWGSSYIDHDIWAKTVQMRQLWSDGAVWLDDEMVPRDEFLASRFYREFLSTIGIGRVCLGLVFDGAPGLTPTSLSIFRDAHEPAFNKSDAQWMRLLISHVSRGLGLMQRLDTARLQRTSLLASFDRLSFGVALLGQNMQVLHLNEAAQTATRRRDGIVVGANGQLDSKASQGRSQSLSHWLGAARDVPVTKQTHFLDGFRVDRSNGEQYVVQCAPVSATSGWAAQSEEVRFVVFITDPAALNLPSVASLVKLFGLTEKQAKVALEFVTGATYRVAARRQRISEETVRSHVKAIYLKTRVNRQADLVRLVLSLSQARV